MAQEFLNTNDSIDPENRVAQWLCEYKETQNEATKHHLRELIVLTYMPLVKKVARSLARRSTDPIEDITQVGALGLIKAVDLFKPEISSNFRTYATYLITGEIRHYLRDKSTIIRAPREIKELSYRVHKITLELTEKLGTTPSDKELAQALQMSEKKKAAVTQSQKMMVFVLSMSLYGLATLFTELIPKFQVGVVEFSVEYFLFIPLTLSMLKI